MDYVPAVTYAWATPRSSARELPQGRTNMACLREADTEPIPGYRLIEPLGSGGFGEVWKCEAPGGILKAIKFVFGNLNGLDDDAAKAEQEAAALERVKLIRHPFILSMDLIKVVNGELLIVMEMADRSLHDLFEEYKTAGRKGIPRETLIGFMADAADGLDHMIEKHNLQHLDVKPKNLFLIADRVKVADFGLVRGMEREGNTTMMGGITPVYAAPETFTNKLSKHSDQYSLAVVYCELLSGQKPFNGRNIRQLAMQHMMEPPDLTMLPEQDRAVVRRALSKNPEERYPNCTSFVRALLGSNSGERSFVPAFSTPHERTTLPQPARSANGSNLLLVTPGARTSAVPTPSQIPNTRRPMIKSPNANSGQSLTASLRFEPDAGVLRPAVMIGVGSFGRRALQQIRCRLLDRLGQLSQIPCLRYLYVDPDPQASEKASSAASDVSLTSEQVFPTPLQPVTNYRRRQIDDLMQWLPREKLYSIPRSLRVDGSRALGRLAFCDHYLRFANRIKHEITVSTSPEALHQSSTFTGLTVRTKQPAVYIFISASGGTSGMLLDLGHAVRRSLEKVNLAEAPVSVFILTGAVHDTNSPAEELGNVFATLTELNHFSDPDVPFTARYGGPEGPQVDVRGLPFSATYLLPMATRTADAFRDVTSHLAGYVTYDLTTPLGSGLDTLRQKPILPGRSPFRGFGTFGVWYPRGLLLRSAARQTCVDLLRQWSELPQALPPVAEALLREVMAESRLTPEPVKKFIVAQSAADDTGDPLAVLANWVLEATRTGAAGGRRPDPIGWAMGIWDTVRDWLGMEPTTESDSGFRRGRLSKQLDLGLRRAFESWNDELTARISRLEKMAGPRLGATQSVLTQLVSSSAGAMAAMEKQLEEFVWKRESAKVAVQEAVTTAQKGGEFSLFGNREVKSVRAVIDAVKQFVDLRVAEDLTVAAAQFYRRLHARFQDWYHTVHSARERLGQLADLMEAPILLTNGSSPNPHLSNEAVEEATQTTLRGSNTTRVVLPKGQEHLERSAADLLESVSPQALADLESILTTLVLDPRGGLTQLCSGTADLAHQLTTPLIDQATVFLSGHLPSEDVSAVEHSAAHGSPDELARRVNSYIRGAAPLSGGPTDDERMFVVYPDTEPGRAYADVVKQVSPNAYCVPVRGAGTDLMFCREQPGLRMADLFNLIDPCWDAYQTLANSVIHNPHSRFDVAEWLPLVE